MRSLTMFKREHKLQSARAPSIFGHPKVSSCRPRKVLLKGLMPERTPCCRKQLTQWTYKSAMQDTSILCQKDEASIEFSPTKLPPKLLNLMSPVQQALQASKLQEAWNQKSKLKLSELPQASDDEYEVREHGLLVRGTEPLCRSQK